MSLKTQIKLGFHAFAYGVSSVEINVGKPHMTDAKNMIFKRLRKSDLWAEQVASGEYNTDYEDHYQITDGNANIGLIAFDYCSYTVTMTRSAGK